jgi:predicted dehydrogenase
MLYAMSHSITRRKAVQSLGFLSSSLLTSSWLDVNENGEVLHYPDTEDLSLDKAVTAITLGAGNRGNVYGNFALKYPEALNIVGVAEPIDIRNQRYCEKHDIDASHSFETWEHVFEQEKFADAVIISTPDDLHYGPCMAALKAGYDVLLEKPISPSEKECRDILELAEKTGRIVAVCHVLRYAPYFVELREAIHNGSIGELVSIQHFEPIEHVHMAHSFVRGNWHNSVETTPIILAKSCHDLDIMRWLVGQPCKKVSAFGGLKWFHSGNKPEGATPRCMDGCAIEKECPYSAMKIYYRDRQRTYVFDLPEDRNKHGDAILDYLKTTNYGRCVYDMENDQADHYVMTLEFDKGITASFNMEAFTSYHGRRTRIMGSHGDIVGDMSSFTHTDFLTGKKTEWSMTTDGHGGGDWKLVADWVKAVSKQDPSILTSSIDASIESHLMGFAAEQSRRSGQVKNITI